MPTNLDVSDDQINEKDAVFLNVLRIGVIVVSAVWIIEMKAGLTQYYDHVGYGTTIALTLFSYWLSRVKNQTYIAKVVIFVYIAVYLLTLAVMGFLQAAREGEIYSIASTLQWVPIIYILAFLFLDKRPAIIGGLAVYLILVVMLVLTYTGVFPISNPELRVLMVNMGLSHGLYIVCMYAVMRLRQTTRKQTVIARRMERAANQDSMLSIANRRNLQELMAQLMAAKKPVSVLLIDVDNFKSINDNFGHATGDEVLKKVVGTIASSMRPVDRIGRWGGEEFLLLADVSHEEDALSFAQRVCKDVADKLADNKPPVTVSIGVAEYKGEGNIEAKLHEADKALYRAKEQGRNQAVLF